MKVAILESLGISDEELRSLEKPFEEKGVEFAHYTKSLDENVLLSELDGADVAVIANMPFPSSVVSKANGLKFIDVAFTGTDHVGLDAAREGDSGKQCLRLLQRGSLRACAGHGPVLYEEHFQG